MIKFPKLFATVLSISLLSTVFGQTRKEKIETYIEQYKSLAISEMLRTGVPASVTLAQGILETAAGESELAEYGNNHFGIKCKSDWTGDRMSHDDDAKNECFRKYASVEESFRDHSDFLKSRPNYAFLFKLGPTDYEGWAKGLKRAGYATSSTYAQQLIRLIVENNLQQFTLLAMQGSQMPDELFATASLSSTSPLPITEEAEEEQEAPIETPVVVENTFAKQKRSLKYTLNSVFAINDIKVIYAEAGTSLLALANNYNVSLKKLIEFNDLEEADILSDNQLIFLQKKSKKGTKEVHIVQENETLHDIAQTEGMQLSAIMEYNKLQKGMQPATGEKLYLKSPAPTSPVLAVSGTVKTSAGM